MLRHPSLYGSTLDCACGAVHAIEPARVELADDALARLPVLLEACATGRRVVLLDDARTRDVAGEEAVDRLEAAGWGVTHALVPDPAPGASPVCDDVTRAALETSLPEADAFVAVGSGVVNDLVKWIAGDRGRPYLAVATAASMNGYASANVAPTLNGLKSLARARPPRGVAARPADLAAAPHRLTASGLGDILAKSCSSADWRLNHLLFDDPYCAASVELIAEIEPLYLERPEAIRDHEPEAVNALFEGLLLTGVAMTMAGSSAPASGGEHLVSHTLDMLSSLDGAPHDLHGRQVGVGTILCAGLYERLLAMEAPAFDAPVPPPDRALWGRLAGPVEAAFAQKRERHARAAALLRAEPARWERIRRDLAGPLRPAAAIRETLRRAEAAWRAEDLGLDRDRLRTALRHAHSIRSRFTVLDLAWMSGLLPDAIDELLAGV